MRPLSLKGHDRALTRVRFNREGDLLFSAAKNKMPCVWYQENGERIGELIVVIVYFLFRRHLRRT